MQNKVAKVFLIFGICCITRILAVKSRTCGELENKIKSYKDEIASLKTSLEEYELVIGKKEDISDDCNESLTCSDCLWGKKIPECGWCVLRNRCSLSQNCPANSSSSDFWISGSDRCPKIRTVKPHNIPASRPTELQIIIPYLPNYDGIFICSFEVLGQTLTTKGKQLDQGITCASPPSDYLPRIPIGNDHMTVKLSVRTPNGPNFASTSNFTIYDCSRFQTCSECAASVFSCSWCIVGNKCTHDVHENCRNDIFIFSNSVTRPTTRQGPSYCPRISSFNGAENEILVPSGSKKRISVKLENIMLFHVEARFTCKVKGFPEVTGQLLGDTLYCKDINLRVLGRQPVYNLSFSVFWGGEGELDNPLDLHVVVYHCGRIAKSCGECLDLPEKYNCGWCEEDNSCDIKDNCVDPVWLDDKHVCKRPEITSVYPTVGLLTSKTNLTIEGINLAKEFKDIESITLIDEKSEVLANCVPYENLHVRHSRIVCLIDTSDILLENNGTLSGYIEVKISSDPVAISVVPYSFVDPIITGFQPVKGMVSGGTILKISGNYLDVGNDVEVYIGDLPCHIISSSRSSIRCITSRVPTDQPAPKSSVLRVLFDGEERMSSGYFFYVADPSVHSVRGEHGLNNPVGTPSGGNLIIVEGTNFDYVPSPYIYVTADGVEYPGVCTVISEIRMECLSPRIPSETLNFCDEEGSLSFNYGFRMGDVESVQNISWNADFGMYRLYPDPHLLPFSEEKKIKISNSDYLTLQGMYLDSVFNEKDFTVTVGDKECLITSLSHTQLTCTIPHMQPEDYEETRLFEVQVKIRASLEYFIGFLRLEKKVNLEETSKN